MNSRLLFVANADWAFVSHRLPIALEAIKRGYEVHIATPITDKADMLTAHGLIVHPLYLKRKSINPICNMRSFLQLLILTKKIKPKIIHLITIKPILLGGIAARLNRVPALVIAVSGMGFVYIATGIAAKLRRKLVGFLYRIVFTHTNLKVIFQNKDDQKILANTTKLPLSKSILIPGSGVALDTYQAKPLPTGMPRIVMACRLLVDKGVREFITAAHLVKQSGYDAHFMLVGECDFGNPTSLTETELKELTSDDHVEYCGHQTNMPDILANAHIVVLPSYREGLPKVLIEAAACGRAVVTTDVPGCRDAIEPNISGLLVPVHDANALANAIKRLLDDPEYCAQLGEAGRRLAERKFDIHKIVAQQLSIYSEMMASPDST